MKLPRHTPCTKHEKIFQIAEFIIKDYQSSYTYTFTLCTCTWYKLMNITLAILVSAMVEEMHKRMLWHALSELPHQHIFDGTTISIP